MAALCIPLCVPDAAARLVQRRQRETAVRRQARNLTDEPGNEDYHETFVRDESRALLIAYRCESAGAPRMDRCPDSRSTLSAIGIERGLAWLLGCTNPVADEMPFACQGGPSPPTPKPSLQPRTPWFSPRKTNQVHQARGSQSSPSEDSK